MGNTLYQQKLKKKIAYISIAGIVLSIALIVLCINSLNSNASSDTMTPEDILLSQYNELEKSKNEIEEKEIIEEVKPVVKKVKTSDGKSYDTIAVLNIPSLKINYPVLSSTSKELLKISLNKYWGANPNQVGNMCIVGHNYNDGKFFSNLSKIKKGAEIELTDMNDKTLIYKVYHTEIVDPYNTDCTSQLTNGKTEITLITCAKRGTQRFIVKARAI